MFHAASVCLAMSPPIRFVVAAVFALLVTTNLVRGEGCHAANRPIYNNDFYISCDKLPLTGVTLEIQCHNPDGWGEFPKNNITLKSINVLVIKDCTLPPALTLRDLTESMLKITQFEVLEFENFFTPPTREFFKGFNKLNMVKFTGGNMTELPVDLFQEIEVENFEAHDIGLTKIPDNFFKNSMKPEELENLDIVQNNLAKLRHRDFEYLVSLKNLSLFNNGIMEVEEHTFDNLTSLQVLELSNNKLKTLPAESLKKLINLKIINLSANEFNSLPSNLLQISNNKLETLKFNYNRGELKSLPNGFLRNVKRLKNVELINNNLESLSADAFVDLKSMIELDLRHNNLVTLPPGIFEHTSNLHVLDISNNLLEYLPDGIFEDSDLTFLHLDHNYLTNITTNMLVGLSDLQGLNASFNRISHITKDFCSYVNKIINVDFSHNHLSLKLDRANYSILANCSSLYNVNVSYNEIVQMPHDWVHNSKLQDINFEGNRIAELTINAYLILGYGSKLNLKNNKIHTVNLHFQELESEAVNIHQEEGSDPAIILDDNPLNCTCDLLGFSRYFDKKRKKELKLHIDIQADKLKCSEPPLFKNMIFKDIDPSKLSCLKKSSVKDDACKDTCTCWEYPGKPLLLVDCSHRNLTQVPKNIINSYNWSIELNMSGNKLRETPALNQSYLLNVTSLDLSNNSISTVTPKVISKSLRVLKLDNNNITRLDNAVLGVLNSNTVLTQLTLHKNKWECTCQSRNFLNFIKKKMSSNWTNLHEIVCENNGRALYTITSNELCENTEKMVLIVVLISLTITCFGLLMGVTAALYYKYENEIKVWLYAKQWCMWLITEDELDKNKQYDAFISFSHKDEDFVEKEIVSKLEDGPEPFKLCLHYRDWIAGEWIPENIARSVEESRRTIVILSPNFIESIWGRMEFRTAHCRALSEGRVRVIVILYGDIGDIENFDPELKAYLDMNTYIKWGDPWFWDKLKYALPHRYEPKRKKKSQSARLIELHMAQAMNNHDGNKVENIPLPKINETSNDSAKLLDSTGEDERMIP